MHPDDELEARNLIDRAMSGIRVIEEGVGPIDRINLILESIGLPRLTSAESEWIAMLTPRQGQIISAIGYIAYHTYEVDGELGEGNE